MNCVFELSHEIPFFKRWWIKRQLIKYVDKMGRKIAAVRDAAHRDGVVLNEHGVSVNRSVPYDRSHEDSLRELKRQAEIDLEFIKNPPKEFPMTPGMVRTALCWNKRSIELLTDKVDAGIWWMFDGEGMIVSLHPAEPGLDCLIREMNEEYAALIKRRESLNKILLNDAPRKFPRYKQAVKQLIKDL